MRGEWLAVLERETAERMGRAARADAQQRFLLTEMVDRLEECYARLLTTGSRAGSPRSVP